MADFARILAAIDRVQGWDTLRSYTAAADDATHAVLESHPVAAAVLALVGSVGTWQGTTSELLDRIMPERRPYGPGHSPPEGSPAHSPDLPLRSALTGSPTNARPVARAGSSPSGTATRPRHERGSNRRDSRDRRRPPTDQLGLGARRDGRDAARVVSGGTVAQRRRANPRDRCDDRDGPADPLCGARAGRAAIYEPPAVWWRFWDASWVPGRTLAGVPGALAGHGTC